MHFPIALVRSDFKIMANNGIYTPSPCHALSTNERIIGCSSIKNIGYSNKYTISYYALLQLVPKSMICSCWKQLSIALI